MDLTQWYERECGILSETDVYYPFQRSGSSSAKCQELAFVSKVFVKHVRIASDRREAFPQELE